MQLFYCNTDNGYNVYKFYNNCIDDNNCIDIFSNSLSNAIKNYMSGWSDNKPLNISSSDILIKRDTQPYAFFLIDDNVVTSRKEKYVMCKIKLEFEGTYSITNADLYIIMHKKHNVAFKRVCDIFESEAFNKLKVEVLKEAYGTDKDIIYDYCTLEYVDEIYVELPKETKQNEFISIDKIND